MMISGNLKTGSVNTLLPSVLAETNALGVTSRYKHIQTSDILDALQGQGFNLVAQNGSKNQVHGKHGLLLVNREIGFVDNSGSDNFATVSLFNSHDGKSAVTLVSGFFRQVCANGLIAGNADQWLKLRHSQKGFDLIGSTVEQLPQRVAAFRDFIQTLQKTELSGEQARQLAELVFDRVKNIRKLPDADSLLSLRRVNDKEMDAYTLMNVMQENAVRGGMLTANSNRRLRPLNRLNSQNHVTGIIVNTFEDYLKNAA